MELLHVRELIHVTHRGLENLLHVWMLNYRSGSGVKLHSNKVETGLSPWCLTEGWHAVIVWFEFWVFGNIMKRCGYGKIVKVLLTYDSTSLAYYKTSYI